MGISIDPTRPFWVTGADYTLLREVGDERNDIVFRMARHQHVVELVKDRLVCPTCEWTMEGEEE